MRTKKNKTIVKVILTAITLIMGLCCIYPFIFMISSSFKPSGDVLSTPLQIIPKNFTLTNFETLFHNEFYDFFKWFGNTVVMTGLTLILKFFIITITAYGFAKIKFPGRDAIFLVLLAGLMIPSDIMIMPRYIIFKQLHILNTMWALILPAAVDVYFVFLLRQAFVAVPDALSEAARIDGWRNAGACARHHCVLPVPEILCGRHHRRCREGVMQDDSGSRASAADRAVLQGQSSLPHRSFRWALDERTGQG